MCYSSQPPAVSQTPVDVTEEQKGRNIMDTLLSMFIKKDAPNLIDLNNPPPMSPDAEHQMAIDEEKKDHERRVELGRGRLLCLDGGGIRGLVLVQMLLEIEKMSQTPIHHMFDWIAGTSTGGILALALGAGKTMKQCMCMYLRMKDQAFQGSRPYASENLENILKDSLGANSVMTDIAHPKIMVTGVMADRKPVDLHLFRNYNSASDILGIVTPERKYNSNFFKCFGTLPVKQSTFSI